ncbi:MAG TPA: hypothetical protein VFB99_06585, partial [Vicinamibacterales bacterium]|nr:hypothetical protein [Vicinamibacterales bacterium]
TAAILVRDVDRVTSGPSRGSSDRVAFHASRHASRRGTSRSQRGDACSTRFAIRVLIDAEGLGINYALRF